MTRPVAMMPATPPVLLTLVCRPSHIDSLSENFRGISQWLPALLPGVLHQQTNCFFIRDRVAHVVQEHSGDTVVPTVELSCKRCQWEKG